MQARAQSSTVLRFIDELFAAPIITISRAEKLLGVTYKAAQQNIEKLEAAGILRETTKKQRNRVYIAQGIMDLLDEQDLPPDKTEEQNP
jgi:Fic family protein